MVVQFCPVIEFTPLIGVGGEGGTGGGAVPLAAPNIAQVSFEMQMPISGLGPPI